MFVNYSNHNYLNKSLRDVLEKFYTAEVLWTIVTGQVYPVLKQAPPEKRPRKEVMVDLLEELLCSEEFVSRLFEAMAPDLRVLYDILVWGGNYRLDDLEKKTGLELTTKTVEHPKYYQRERISHTPKPGLYWVIFSQEQGYYNNEPVIVGLPPALRTVFKKHMPKPAGYHVEPIDALPPDLKTFCCADQLVEDFRVVADYIARGHLQFTQNETIKKPCIRAVAGLTSGGEFFPNEKLSAKLPLLRHEMFVGLIAICGATLREAMLEEPPDPARLLRSLCDTLFEHPEWLHEIVLHHVKPKGCEAFSKKASANLRELFAMLPEGQWVRGSNLETIVNYRDINLDPIQGRRFVTVDRTSKYYDYTRQVEVDNSNGWALQVLPFLQGTAFLLAAIGWAEIAYTLPPEHPMWKRPSERFLTPYDGLYAIRLTPAGAYAFGLRNELELKRSMRERAEIILNPRRLTATCRHIDPITEMSLLEYMEKVSDGCYRMTRQSLMRGCAAQKDVEQRVAAFRRHIVSELPPFWKTFFDSAVQTAVALRSLEGYRLYDLADNPELRRLFTSDSLLRRNILKVEGLRVAVKKADEPAVRRRLTELGYLML